MSFWNRKKKSASTFTSVTQTPREEGPTVKHYFQAAYDGNLEKVQECIESGIDKEAKNSVGSTTLHYACSNGHLEIVQYLIETCQVDKEAKNNNGETALHYASWKGHLEIVKYLVETCQVDTEAKDKDGQSAFDQAKKCKKSAVVQYLRRAAAMNGNLHGLTTVNDNGGVIPPLLVVNANPQNHRDNEQIPEQLAPTIENFFDAAETGNLDKIEECIKNGIDKGTKNNDGWTALHVASDSGHLDVVRYLIETCHVDKEAKNNDGWTALHAASRFGRLEIVKYLIETCHLDKEAKDNNRWTALHCAIYDGHLETVKYLIETCHVDTQTKNLNGHSAYGIAMASNKSEIVQYFEDTTAFDVFDNEVIRKASSSATTLQKQEETKNPSAVPQPIAVPTTLPKSEVQAEAQKELKAAILRAVDSGDIETMKQCIINIKRDKNDSKRDEIAALHYASINGRLKIVQYLLETCHLEKEARDHDGNTALHLASSNGHLETVKYLTGTVHVEPSAKDYFGWTALHHASLRGHFEIVKYLLEACVIDAEAKNNAGNTSLHFASYYGHVEIIQYIMESHLIDKEAKNNDGWTVLHQASSSGRLEIVQYLVENFHVDTESKTNDGQTAYDLSVSSKKSDVVHYLKEPRTKSTVTLNELMTLEQNENQAAEFLDAAKNGNLDVVKKCITNGVDKEAKNDRGYTSLHFASDSGHLDIVIFLIETCDVNKEAQSNGGWTALHFASYNGDLDMVKYLIETCHVDMEKRNKRGQTPYDFALKNNKTSTAEYLVVATTNLTTFNDEKIGRNQENVDSAGDQENNDKAPASITGQAQYAASNFGAMKRSTDILILNSDLKATSSSLYELNSNWMMKLQDDNQQLLDMLSQFGSSVQFIEERRDLLDLIVVEKCMTIEEQDEQSAIFASPKHRDFYLLFQRKLKCMIKSCETLSTGMVGVNGGDMRKFIARTIYRDNGCNFLKETKVGFLIASAVQWAQNNLAVVPFIDTVGSVFQVIVALRDEHDRYEGLARVSDFATMTCLARYGTTSLDVTIEKVARHVVRARVGSPSCEFVEERDQFGKLKQLIISLLADSGNTPAKEQASKAADCAFAHIMKPSKDSVLFDVLNDSICDIGLAEALAATVLGISLQDLKQFEPFSASPPADAIVPANDPNVQTANVANVVCNGTSVSAAAPFHPAAYASSDVVAEQVAKLRKQEEMIQKQEAMIQQQHEMMQKQGKSIHQLSQKVARLEKVAENDSGGGTMYARPEDVFRNEIAKMKNLNNNVRGLTDEVTTIDYQVTNHNLRILILEERLQERESTGASEKVRSKNNKK